MGSSVQALLDLVKSEAVTVRGLEADALNVLGDLHPVASVVHRLGVATSRLDQPVSAPSHHPAGEILANFSAGVHTAKHTLECAGWYSGRMNCATETRHALYRFYDRRERLLYVGISNDPWRRWREHVRTQPWYPSVQHQAVTWYESEDLARAAETAAIHDERPRFNIAGAVRPVRSGHRREVAEKSCTAWLITAALLLLATVIAKTAIPAGSAAVAGVRVLVWISEVAMLTGFLPLAGMYLLLVTPQVYRFGCWLNLHFGDEAGRPA